MVDALLSISVEEHGADAAWESFLVGHVECTIADFSGHPSLKEISAR